MRTLTAFVLALALFVAPQARAGDDPAVGHLVLFLEEFGQQSGLPTGEDAERIRPHLSAALNAAIDRSRAYQARFIAENPDEKPPWIEGPLFNSSGYEAYTGYAIVHPATPCSAPRCVIRTEYADTTLTPPLDWHDEYVLVHEDGQWRIDDVQFRGETEYRNHGTLRGNLLQADSAD
jgi:hypothetical protein